jgi:dTDP-4-amino-4,6-dideoxygalactose transaminase
MINVTKSYLPDINQYNKYIEQIWESCWLTNNGPLLLELEKELKDHLNVKHLFFCTNGTIAIQIAIKALNLNKEVITTPFSYVATTNSILWENCKPVFVDINNKDFNIDAGKIEDAITANTQAILATHVYGNPCDVEAIKAIAVKNGLQIIYDGAHAFDCLFKDQQVLSFGDISTCSFHATKLFHTIEGGCIITDNDELARKILLYRQFGHEGDDYFSIGINGKNSEFHAAMGLCVLPQIQYIKNARKEISEQYNEQLKNTGLTKPVPLEGSLYNYGYYPVVFKNETSLLAVKNSLHNNGINTRRYFYPSLNTLPFLQGSSCPVSEDISSRILCLPLYDSLALEDVKKICSIIENALRAGMHTHKI